MVRVIRTTSLFCPVVALLLICGGCGSRVVESSGQRPPTTPDKVKIYEKPPQRYERLGKVTVPVTPEIRWDERGESNLGIDRLKGEAAKRGANGLLLVVADGSSDATATVGYHGTFYQVPMQAQPRAALAEAIYVLEQ